MDNRFFTERQVDEIWDQMCALAVRDMDLDEADPLDDRDCIVVSGGRPGRRPAHGMDGRRDFHPVPAPAPYHPGPWAPPSAGCVPAPDYRPGIGTIRVQDATLTFDAIHRSVSITGNDPAARHRELTGHDIDMIIGDGVKPGFLPHRELTGEDIDDIIDGTDLEDSKWE